MVLCWKIKAFESKVAVISGVSMFEFGVWLLYWLVCL